MKTKTFLYTFFFFHLFSAIQCCPALHAQDQSFSIDDEIPHIQTNLNDDIFRRGLLDTVANFNKKRSHVQAFEYNCKIENTYQKSLKALKNALEDNHFDDSVLNVANVYIPAIKHSYRINKMKFDQCLAAMQDDDKFNERLIVRSQFYFAVILLATDKSEYEKAKDNFSLLPFCD